MLKRALFVILGMLLVGIVTTRILAPKAFELHPEKIPVTEVPQSRLAKITQFHLTEREDTESLFVPLGAAETSFLSRIALADAADHTLDLQYYLFHDDDAGRALLAAAVEAADRGVAVRLLIDDMDTAGREGNLIRLMQDHPGLSIRVYNPVYTRKLRVIDYIARFPRSSRRMHNKSMTADRIGSVVGGRNVGNEYFNINTPSAFADFDVIIAGPLSSKVADEFDQYWYSGLAVDIARLGSASTNHEYTKWREQVQADLNKYRVIAEQTDSQVVKDLITQGLIPYYTKGEVIYDDPEKILYSLKDKTGRLAPRILQLMEAATTELLIISPYFIPGDAVVERFAALERRGVAVTVLTNSMAANDVFPVHAAYAGYRKDLLRAGVDIYEFKSDSGFSKGLSLTGIDNASLHAKTFIVDRSLTYVGSFNLDPRSAVHNTEMGVVLINNRYGNSATNTAINGLNSTAYQLALTDEGNIEWISNRQAKREVFKSEPDSSWLTRAAAGIISLLPVEWLL